MSSARVGRADSAPASAAHATSVAAQGRSPRMPDRMFHGFSFLDGNCCAARVLPRASSVVGRNTGRVDRDAKSPVASRRGRWENPCDPCPVMRRNDDQAPFFATTVPQDRCGTRRHDGRRRRRSRPGARHHRRQRIALPVRRCAGLQRRRLQHPVHPDRPGTVHGLLVALPRARPRAPAPHRHLLREPSHRGRHVLGLARGDLYRPAHAA